MRQDDVLPEALERVHEPLVRCEQRLSFDAAAQGCVSRLRILDMRQLVSSETAGLMDEGELYLAAPGCERPVSLSHLLVLRGAPASERYTAYFFNRQEADNQARLVTYQLSETSSLVEPLAGLDLGLPELLR